MRGMELLDRTNRFNRMRSFENLVRQHPGAAPGGTGTTGLMSGDARGYSDLLNRQTQYLNDQRAEDGKGPMAVEYGGVMGEMGGGRRGGRTPRVALDGLRTALDGFGGGRGGGVVAHEVRPDTRPLERALIDAGIAGAGAQQRMYEDMGGERDDLRMGRMRRAADYDLEYREPTRARHRAVVGDIESEAEAGRAFLPNAAKLGDMEAERARRLAEIRYLEPARIGAESRTRAAEIEREGRIGAADRTLQGARGRNETAALRELGYLLDDKELGPALRAQLQQSGDDPIRGLRAAIQSLLGGDMGGGGDDELLDYEDAIAELMALGLSREEADAELRGGGA